MIVFLLSERSSNCTRQIIYVDAVSTHLDKALVMEINVLAIAIFKTLG